MNAYTGDQQAAANLEPEALIDWTVDVDRISRLARDAFLTGTPDPWTKIEAECVVQLIDAELIALTEKQNHDHRVEASIRHLKALRTETVLAMKTLESVQRYGLSQTAAAGADPAWANGQTLSRSTHHQSLSWRPHSLITLKSGDDQQERNGGAVG